MVWLRLNLTALPQQHRPAAVYRVIAVLGKAVWRKPALGDSIVAKALASAVRGRD